MIAPDKQYIWVCEPHFKFDLPN